VHRLDEAGEPAAAVVRGPVDVVPAAEAADVDVAVPVENMRVQGPCSSYMTLKPRTSSMSTAYSAATGPILSAAAARAASRRAQPSSPPRPKRTTTRRPLSPSRLTASSTAWTECRCSTWYDIAPPPPAIERARPTRVGCKSNAAFANIAGAAGSCKGSRSKKGNCESDSGSDNNPSLSQTREVSENPQGDASVTVWPVDQFSRAKFTLVTTH
jgi:hypothetical protein